MLQFKRPKNKPIVNHFKSQSSGFNLDLVLASQDSSLQGIFLVKDQMDSGSFSLIRAVGVPIINAQSSKSDLPSPQPSQSCFIPDSGPRILGPFTPDIWVYMLSSRGGGPIRTAVAGPSFSNLRRIPDGSALEAVAPEFVWKVLQWGGEDALEQEIRDLRFDFDPTFTHPRTSVGPTTHPVRGAINRSSIIISCSLTGRVPPNFQAY